jgi:predicted DNA-binding ArsR family transcriptional regulator
MDDLSTDISNNYSNEIDDQQMLKRNTSKVPITLNIRYKTQTFSVECDLYDTLKTLKDKVDKLTDVDPQVQKLVNKSITSVKRDDTTTTLKDLNITDGQTLLLVGATRSEILSTTRVNTNSTGNKDSTDDQATTINKKEPLCKQTKHEKVLKAGK